MEFMANNQRRVINQRNTFPISYTGINETNLLAQLFLTYSSIEYRIKKIEAKTGSGLNSGSAKGLYSSNSSLLSMVSLGTSRNSGNGGEMRVGNS